MHAVLLRYREYDLQRSMRDLLLLELTQCLQNGHDARFVIRAQDSRSIGADDPILDNRMNSCTGIDTVHMRSQHDCRRIRPGSREIRHEIAAIPAQIFSRLILSDRAAQLSQPLSQEIADCPLIMRRTGNLDQLQEFLQDAVLIDCCHEKTSFPDFPDRLQQNHQDQRRRQTGQRIALRQLDRIDLRQSGADDCCTSHR